jgi:transposase
MNAMENQSEMPMSVPQVQVLRQPGLSQLTQVRVRRPVRNQVEMLLRDLDSLIPEDHPVRAIWDYLQRLDLSSFYASIKATLDTPGRPASDPQVLLGLWIYAITEDVGSARYLAELCREHDAYRWLCGGVPVDYHLLADFRVSHQTELDQLLTGIIATMMDQKLVTLKRVAHDGTRLRASAGRGSFHRKDSLHRCLAEAEEQLKRLNAEREHPDSEVRPRQRAARERAARERLERVQAALRELPTVEAAKERQRRTKSKKDRSKIREARVSTTEPQSRVMRLADGGFAPAHNVQLATDVGSGVIVGAMVLNEGSDKGSQAEEMEDQVVARSGQHPEDYLIDGGFAELETITALTKRHLTVYAPLREPKSETKKSSERREGDSPAVLAWRQRMETEAAKEIYKLRAASAEWTNAQIRWHGLRSFTVRGLGKALSIVLLVAIAHNLMRWVALTAQGVMN